MKRVILIAFALTSLASAQAVLPQTAVWGINFNTPAIAAWGPLLFIQPSFQPQLQVYIDEPKAVPPSYLVTISYVDAGGAPRSVTQSFMSSTPFPNGVTLTLATFFVDAYVPITISVTPLQIAGPAILASPGN